MELQNLNECAWECTRQSRWKESTQRYLSDMLQKNLELREEILSGQYRVKPTIDFTLNKRGHIRQIEAPVVRDRRRLKAFRRQLDLGMMTEPQIWEAYQSWRGSVVRDHNACEHSLRAMDALYASLFPPHQERPKRSRRALIVQMNHNINAEELYCLTH